MKWSSRCTAHQSVGIQSTTCDSYCQSNSSPLTTVPHPTTHALTQVSCWTWFSEAFRWWMGGRQRHETDCNTHRNPSAHQYVLGCLFLPCSHMWRRRNSSSWRDHVSSHAWIFTLGIAFSSVQPFTPENLIFLQAFWFLTNTASLSLLGPFFIQLTFNRELSMCEEP